jgi:nucleoside-diphosphate kinase
MKTTTLAIIKPDAVAKGAVGYALQMAEISGLRVKSVKWVHMTPAVAGSFYLEHVGKPFFDKLVAFMCSGPSIVVALQGELAIERWRETMKGVRKTEADPNHSERNAVHGSDSPASALRELMFFFSEPELDAMVDREPEESCLDCGSPIEGAHGQCQDL